ncbi:MAG TPA: DUF2283 domain-containing protein [Solirubrobacteraceae bacterium]|nr:DUF2283 domain-containing protein [Solirubrobacteraceae bacterium]
MTIDFRHRMIGVRLNDERVAWTDQLDDAHLVDVDAAGQVVGIDIMTLDDLRLDEMARRFGFADHVPAIMEAIHNVMTPATAGSSGAPIMIQGRVSQLPAEVRTTEPPTRPIVPPVVV